MSDANLPPLAEEAVGAAAADKSSIMKFVIAEITELHQYARSLFDFEAKSRRRLSGLPTRPPAAGLQLTTQARLRKSRLFALYS